MDWFEGAIRDEAELRAVYEESSWLVQHKQIDHLDQHCRDYLAVCAFVVLASADAQGRADVTPRGGPRGFVRVLDDRTLAIPDATGNRRIDTLRNVVQTGQLGMLALLPGRGQTLRVNGRACVSTDPALLGSLTAVGKPPRAALVMAVEEVFTHCPKAFVRSGLWDPSTWPGTDEQPSPAAMLRDHVGDPALTLAAAEQAMRDAVTQHLP
jgi:PPOX class probable FMN-dependent enzyme